MYLPKGAANPSPQKFNPDGSWDTQKPSTFSPKISRIGRQVVTHDKTSAFDTNEISSIQSSVGPLPPNITNLPSFKENLKTLKTAYNKRNPLGQTTPVAIEKILKEMKPTGPTAREIHNQKHGINPTNLGRHRDSRHLRQRMENTSDQPSSSRLNSAGLSFDA